MTNEEKIKNMSAKELAQMLKETIMCENCPIFNLCEPLPRTCAENWERWLQSEAE